MTTCTRVPRPVAALLVWCMLAGCSRTSASRDDTTAAVSGAEVFPESVTALGRGTRTAEGRVLLSASFDTLWRRGGAQDDTLLLAPITMAADSSQVYVFDAAAHRVVAFRAQDGQFAWTFGREGRGPGELSAVAMVAVSPLGEIVVLDRLNRRITVLTQQGQVRSEVPWHGRESPANVCPLGDSTFLVGMMADGDVAMARVDRDGRALERRPFPWPGLDSLHPLATQFRMWPLPPYGDCLLAMVLGHGFARLGRAGTAYALPYVERYPLPSMSASPPGAARRSFQVAPGARATASGVAVDGDTLTLIFGGKTRLASRLLDRYDFSSGRYLHSEILPGRTQLLAGAAGRYFVVSTETEYPILSAIRRRRTHSAE